MSSQKIHPAVTELRRFLTAKGDADTSAFLTRWMTSWLGVFDVEVKLSVAAKLQMDDPDGYAFKRGYERLGEALGPTCSMRELDNGDHGTIYSFSVMAFKVNKKLVLDG